jgi:SAM-dependent methyltransferase
VLEVGAGTGYNAALLSHLVGPSGQVTAIDIDPAITQAAQANLDWAGVGANQLAEVEVRTGDGWLGAADRGPFDRIQATVGVWDLAPAWADQLAPTGTLVAPLWLRAGVHATAAFTRPSTMSDCALDGPGAIQLLAPGDEDEEELRGLFDPTPTDPGLALVLQREGQLAAYGSQAALSRLRAHLIGGGSIVFQELAIEAIPTAAATAAPAPGHGAFLGGPAVRAAFGGNLKACPGCHVEWCRTSTGDLLCTPG